MFTIGFVRNNEVYATLRGWLYLSVADILCYALNSAEIRPEVSEVGRYDYVIVVEIKG